MEIQSIKDVLSKFKLSPTEAEILFALMNKGKVTIGSLIKSTHRHRGTVYNTLTRLMQKGFVAISKEKKDTFYMMIEDGFLGYVEQEKNKIKEMDECINEIRKIQKVVKPLIEKTEPSIKIQYGNQAFKNFFIKVLRDCSKKENNYLTYCNGGEMRDILGGDYYRFSQRLKKDMKVGCKVLLSHNKKTHPFSSEVEGRIKWIKNINFPTHGYIHNNKLYLVDWYSTPLVLLEIGNKGIVESYKAFFNSLWKNKGISRKEIVS